MTTTLQSVDLVKLQQTAQRIRATEWRELVKGDSPSTMRDRLDALDSAIEIERAVLRAKSDET